MERKEFNRDQRILCYSRGQCGQKERETVVNKSTINKPYASYMDCKDLLRKKRNTGNNIKYYLSRPPLAQCPARLESSEPSGEIHSSFSLLGVIHLV
jgi:hypothetical protein